MLQCVMLLCVMVYRLLQQMIIAVVIDRLFLTENCRKEMIRVMNERTDAVGLLLLLFLSDVALSSSDDSSMIFSSTGT